MKTERRPDAASEGSPGNGLSKPSYDGSSSRDEAACDLGTGLGDSQQRSRSLPAPSRAPSLHHSAFGTGVLSSRPGRERSEATLAKPGPIEPITDEREAIMRARLWHPLAGWYRVLCG